MGLKELKSQLNKHSKAELVKHISELYKKFKPVKEYFDFYLNPDEAEILEKYKAKVRLGFYPKSGFDIKLSIARSAINEFKKLGTSKEALADLLLYYVECGIELTNEFGDIDENFYTSLENTFDSALKQMNEEEILNKFEARAHRIVENTLNIGWGFHDYLSHLYYTYYK